MPKLIFVNLPVADLARSVAFYEAVGGTRNPQFSDDSAACMMFSDVIHVMLATHAKYKLFTTKPIADTKKLSAVLLCLSADSKTEVDDLIARAVKAGGAPDPSPVDDYDFMYGRSFEDPDGHMWGINWIDLSAMPAAPVHA